MTHISSVPTKITFRRPKKISLNVSPNVEVCTKGRLPPWGHSQHPGYPDAPGRVTERAHPQPKRHQVTKPNPHLGISLTPAILYIAPTSILITVLITAIETCVSFFLGLDLTILSGTWASRAPPVSYSDNWVWFYVQS